MVCFQTVVWTAINSVVSCWFWRVGVSLGPRRWAMCLLECSHTALYPAAPACPPVKVRTHLYSTSPSACLRVKQGEMHWWVWCLSAIQTYTYHWKLLYRLFYIHFKKSSNVKEKKNLSHKKTIFVRFDWKTIPVKISKRPFFEKQNYVRLCETYFQRTFEFF